MSSNCLSKLACIWFYIALHRNFTALIYIVLTVFWRMFLFWKPSFHVSIWHIVPSLIYCNRVHNLFTVFLRFHYLINYSFLVLFLKSKYMFIALFLLSVVFFPSVFLAWIVEIFWNEIGTYLKKVITLWLILSLIVYQHNS